MDHAGELSVLPHEQATAAREEFAAAGCLRLPGFLSPQAHQTIGGLDTRSGAWRRFADDQRDLDLRPLTEKPLVQALARAFTPLGFEPAAPPVLMRHRAGQFGAPHAPAEDACFLIDLNAGWRSEWGGLILFVGDQGRAQGWRPEAGALTLYDGMRPPLLTMVSSSAPEPRLAFFGRLRPTA